MKHLTCISLGALLLSACASEQPICGRWQGILPAADTAGFETTLILKTDGTFTQKMTYGRLTGGTYEESGTYQIKKDIIQLHFDPDEVAYYKKEGSQLKRLDQSQHEITGPLAADYILKQTASCTE